MTGLSLVRALWPKAPKIGTATRIYCGVAARSDGSPCYTVVANRGKWSNAPKDRLRKCAIVGYSITVLNDRTELLVTVRMNQRHRLIERVLTAHAECLEGWPR